MIPLSVIEEQFVLYACQGWTSKDIAQQLFKSLRTVEGYRSRVLRKTGARTMTEAVTILFRKGLLK